jgi:hypothetical protein
VVNVSQKKVFYPGSYEEFSSFLDNRSFENSLLGKPWSLLDELSEISNAYNSSFGRRTSYTYYEGINIFIGYLDCSTFLSMISASSFDRYINVFLLEDKIIDINDVHCGNYSLVDCGKTASSILSERYNIVVGVLKPLEKNAEIFHAVNFFPSIKISHEKGEIESVRGIFDEVNSARKRNYLNFVYSSEPYVTETMSTHVEGANYFELSDYGFLINSSFSALDIKYHYLRMEEKISSSIKMLYLLSTISNLLLWKGDSVSLLHFLTESSFPIMDNGVVKTINLGKFHGYRMLNEICSLRNMDDSFNYFQRVVPKEVMLKAEVLSPHIVNYLLTEKQGEQQ